MPGGVLKASTYGSYQCDAAFFALDIANKGVIQALLDDEHLRGQA
tara:strand:- start:562 stop:696 length:135 start_codon:yes stop_codon:yes gene_type:complete